MEIQDRLFSETSEEVYYSVLMNEEEYSLYSGWSEWLKKMASEVAYIGGKSSAAGTKVVPAMVKPAVRKLPKKPDIPAYWKRST